MDTVFAFSGVSESFLRLLSTIPYRSPYNGTYFMNLYGYSVNEWGELTPKFVHSAVVKPNVTVGAIGDTVTYFFFNQTNRVSDHDVFKPIDGVECEGFE